MEDTVKDGIQRRIREVLNRKDIRATEVAKKLKISEASVSNWKKRNLPSLIEAYKFCEYANIT